MKRVTAKSPLLKIKHKKAPQLNQGYTHHTPREIPSSDVKYMLMV